MTVTANWHLRGYELDRRVGSGASSEVWRARVVSSGDLVALKRLPLAGAEQGRRAVAEAAKLTVLDHPHLIRLHDLVLSRDCAVLVLDLADAGSLADLISVRGRVTPGEAITAIAPIAAALAHVHAAGVVHGDVSPANILFTRAGIPLLADLGVARLVGELGVVEGTPGYIDPVVARGGVPDERTDVFMLAAVALHALTGAALWTASTPDAALAQAASGGLGHVEGRLAVADLPSPIADVLRRALTLDPTRRGSAAELALDLRHSGEPVAVELAAGRTRTVASLREGPARPVDDPLVTTPGRPPVCLQEPRRPATELPTGVALPGIVQRTGIESPATPVLPPATTAAAARPGRARHAATPARRSAGRDRQRRRCERAWTSSLERARHLFVRALHAPGRGSSVSAADQLSTLGPTSGHGLIGFAATDLARPHFVRPSTGLRPDEPGGAMRPPVDRDVVVGRAAPTSAVSKARPALPTRRKWAAVLPGRLARVAIVAVTVLAVVGVLGVLLWHRGTASSAAAPSRAVRPSAPVVRSVGPTETAPAAALVPSPQPSAPSKRSVPDWTAALRTLEDIRARAYATRDPSLFSQVYVPGSLRSTDEASLARLVPIGCGLHGLRAVLAAPHVRSRGRGAVLVVRASLPRSRLVCSGRLARTVAALPEVSLEITLIQHGEGVLIAAEHAVT